MWQLNERFQRSPVQWGYDARNVEQLAVLQEPFSDVVLNAALETAWIEGAPKLMIIHGRSRHRDLLKDYLKSRVGQVTILGDELANTEPITAKFERFASTVDGAIALLTPDDVRRGRFYWTSDGFGGGFRRWCTTSPVK